MAPPGSRPSKVRSNGASSQEFTSVVSTQSQDLSPRATTPPTCQPSTLNSLLPATYPHLPTHFHWPRHQSVCLSILNHSPHPNFPTSIHSPKTPIIPVTQTHPCPSVLEHVLFCPATQRTVCLSIYSASPPGRKETPFLFVCPPIFGDPHPFSHPVICPSLQ